MSIIKKIAIFSTILFSTNFSFRDEIKSEIQSSENLAKEAADYSMSQLSPEIKNKISSATKAGLITGVTTSAFLGVIGFGASPYIFVPTLAANVLYIFFK